MTPINLPPPIPPAAVITAKRAAMETGLSQRTITRRCADGLVWGAFQASGTWFLPIAQLPYIKALKPGPSSSPDPEPHPTPSPGAIIDG